MYSAGEVLHAGTHVYRDSITPLLFLFFFSLFHGYIVRAELIGIFSNWPRCVYLTGTHVC